MRVYNSESHPIPIDEVVLGWSEGTPAEPFRKGWEIVSPMLRNCQYITHWARLPRPPERDCGSCYRCLANDVWQGLSRMVVCAKCGNKRCPKATDCKNNCTGLNEPEQPGSMY